MRQKTSKLLSTLLVLCMVLALLPGTALGAEHLTVYPVAGGSLYFDAETGSITYCEPDVTAAIIPSEINGIAVTSIGYQAFAWHSNLTSVTIPNSVTTIEDQAFAHCTSLTSATIGDGITTIGKFMFTSTSLTSVTIPSSVTTIGEGAFNSCFSLTSVTIPASVTSIEYITFGVCDSLTDVYYGGSENQWKQISMADGNDPLLSANIHYNSPMPGTPKVERSAQNLTVNGVKKDCDKYNIGGSNYFKLRDLAYMLSGTGSQFAVGYDNATKTVTITTGKPYTPDGSEMAIGEDKSATAEPSGQTIMINGQSRGDLTVYNIGGNNYFKLRDLGAALGFDVDYNDATKTAVVRSK